jgi:hypothetical protein
VLAGGDVEEAMRWFLDRSSACDIVVLRASGSDGYNSYFRGLATVDSVEGAGIDEQTALLVEPDRRARVVDAGSAWLLKRQSRPRGAKQGSLCGFDRSRDAESVRDSRSICETGAGGEPFDATVENGVLTTSGLR